MPPVTTFDKKSINYGQLINCWRANPVQAALDIFGAADPDFDLDRPQRVVIESRWKHAYEIDILGRGCGKTFLAAITAWLQAILYPGQKVGIVAPSFRQSKYVWAEIEKLHEISPLIQECCAKHPVRTPEKCYTTMKGAAGHIGSSIEALPMGTDGNKIRGARYYFVIADELAQIDSETLDVVVEGFLATSQNPMKRAKVIQRLKAEMAAGEITEAEFKRAMVGNRFVGSSTAYYQYNHLWGRVQKLIEKTYETKQALSRKGEPHEHIVVKGGPINGGQMPARYMSDGENALCVFPFWDMKEGFLDPGNLVRQRDTMSNYQFLMERCCFFPSDSEGFFPGSLLEAARKHKSFGTRLVPIKGMKYVLGVDPARTGDNFAVALYEVDLTMRISRLVRVWAWKNKPFPEAHQDLREIINQFGVVLVKMDAGGGGTTIRDLLADQRSCPIGQRLVLEQENEDLRSRNGDLILAKLVEFSRYEWVQGANEGLKSGLEHGRVQIAAPSPIPGEIWVPAHEEADAEIDETLAEISSIVTKPVGARLHWDTPSKNQRKDRYSAVLLGFDAANELLIKSDAPQGLADGFWQ